jgi:hypothetical protein
VGERVQRAVRLDHLHDAASAAEGLRPLISSGALHPRILQPTTLRWMEDAGIPESRGKALAHWLYCYAHPKIARKPSPPLPDKPMAEIGIGIKTIGEIVDAAEDALLDAELGLYRRGSAVVRVWPETEQKPDGSEREVHRLTAVLDLHLAELMGQAAIWQRWSARLKDWQPVDCPISVARTYLARQGVGWRLPELTGIITTPTLREDGSVLDIPGHDRQTGLFLDVPHNGVPEIPRQPTKADAAAAIGRLDELLDEFPFKAPVDRSVALAAILTAVVRRSLPTAPLFAFTAPAPGTGKSYLVDLVSTIATGQPAAGLSWSTDDAENRKQLDSALLAGASAIAIDNVTCPLGGDRLNQMLTQPRVSIRRLGESQVADVPCAAFVTANGNNLAIAADMTRRTVLCRLDSGEEHPEHRSFASDPIATVAEDRYAYVADALAVLRAYHVADRPNQPKALASFEAWSIWVRGALVWLGYDDPVASIATIRADDPVRNEAHAVFEQWNAFIGARRVTAAQIITSATTGAGAGEFREALLAVAGVGGAINTRRLGKWLAASQGRPIEGLKLVSAGIREGTKLWALEGGRAVTDDAANVVPFRATPEFADEPLSIDELLI